MMTSIISTVRRSHLLSLLGFSAALYLAVLLHPRSRVLQVIYPIEKIPRGGGEYGDIISIDFGRTESRIAIAVEDKIIMIADKHGNTAIPSFIAYTENGILFGAAAKEYALRDPENTIYDARSLLGLEFSEDAIQEKIGILPFVVVPSSDGKPLLQVQLGATTKLLSPEEVCTEMLKHLKGIAETKLRRPVTHAVMTVPAYFSEVQRQSIKDAASRAGLTLIRITKEPMAAGLAYGIDQMTSIGGAYRDEDYGLLVCEISPSSTHIAVLSAEEGIFDELSVVSDTHVGGLDFENTVFDYMVNEYQQLNSDNEKRDIKTISSIKKQAEIAEKKFQANSPPLSITIDIPAFYPDPPFSLYISKLERDHHHEELFGYIIQLIEKALWEAKLQKNTLNGIILTGDPTHTSLIEPYIRKYFDIGKSNTTLFTSIPSNEVFARGTTVIGKLFSTPSSDYHDFVGWIDVNPLAIGVGTSNGLLRKVIPRNTVIPNRKSLTIAPAAKNQKKITMKIYEGERALAKDNRLLGSVNIPLLEDETDVTVVVDMDLDGSILVVARPNKFTQYFPINIHNPEYKHKKDPELIEDFLQEWFGTQVENGKRKWMHFKWWIGMEPAEVRVEIASPIKSDVYDPDRFHRIVMEAEKHAEEDKKIKDQGGIGEQEDFGFVIPGDEHFKCHHGT